MCRPSPRRRDNWAIGAGYHGASSRSDRHRAAGLEHGGRGQPDDRRPRQRGPADRRGREFHPHHRGADEPSRAQRHHRGGTGRRGWPGLCGRGFGSEGACGSNREGDEDISSQIAAVQAATSQAVDTVGAIATVMGTSTFTARLPARWASRTRRPARSPGISDRRPPGTALVARSIAGTAEATDNANRTADMVLATAHDLSGQATQLRSSVDRFLSNVAA